MARRLHVAFYERGHQTGVYMLPKDRATPPSYQHSSVVAEYFAHCEEQRRHRRGEWARRSAARAKSFPILRCTRASPGLSPHGIRAGRTRPRSGAGTWSMPRAPAEVKDFLRDYYIRYSGPGGMTEQDDMENWNYAHAASRGTIARRYPYSYEQGLGPARPRITSSRDCASRGLSSTSPRRNPANTI